MSGRGQQLLLPMEIELPKLKYKYRADWEATAVRLGYETIEAAIAGEYQRTGSINKTARVFGVTAYTIWYRLKQLGIPRNSRGGPNNFNGTRRHQN